jgi:starch synthase (maltosyl-transferring)
MLRDGRRRVVIESVSPRVSGGDFALKRVVGEGVRVEADIFSDGHDLASAVVLHRRAGGSAWSESPMRPLGDDRWAGEFTILAEGAHEFTIQAWVDHFKTWRADLKKRHAAGQDLAVELLIGAELVEAAVRGGAPGVELRAFASRLRHADAAERLETALDERLLLLMETTAPRRHHAQLERPVRVWVDRVRARSSSWYELFPRSARHDGKTHGTFEDVIGQLDAIAAMGFDVLYLPPVHPIGRAYRKGKNNSLTPGPDDVGSPWAIGGPEGGHDAIHPKLGSAADFERLVREADRRGMEIALDLALQCSPDHPYVKDHPEWFKRRPDGTIQYAENPPKKYQDIYPFDFECADWEALWNEILRVVMVWVDRGIRILRVDNPHTKPFALWEWLIGEVKKREPGVLFLAEAFTRPKVMHRLAKLGFTQSYTYFAWRNGPWDLREYFTDLTQTAAAEYFRPNAWPNTPDILTEYLQHGGRGAFVARAVLAATLCASWGVYGPAFELMDRAPAKAGSEEYLDSEKYQLRAWDVTRADSLAPLLAALNAARRDNPALQQDRTLRFHQCDNPAIVCYSKTSGDNTIVVAVNTDPFQAQWGTVDLDLRALEVEENRPYQMHDLLTGQRFRWQGRRNVVGLDPNVSPAHLFRLRRHGRTEAHFEYFL